MPSKKKKNGRGKWKRTSCELRGKTKSGKKKLHVVCSGTPKRKGTKIKKRR